jgi:glutathione S-transferase
VRIVRLTLREKGVSYDLVPIDVFFAEGLPAGYLERQPFGRIPAFEHEGFNLYETGAIARYIDEAFEGPRLQPSDPRARARVNQIMSIADAYMYRPMVWDIYVERIAKPSHGSTPDEQRIAKALPKALVCLQTLTDLMGDAPWLGGSALTLADLYVAPMLNYFLITPEGEAMMVDNSRLSAWWGRITARPSMLSTEPSM